MKLAALLLVAGIAQGAIPGLMPLPMKIEEGEGRLVIDSEFTVASTGATNARLGAAMKRLSERIARETGLPLRKGTNRAALVVECKTNSPQTPELGEDESYRLDITAQQASLSAATTTGALRGLETFAQLVVPGADGFEAPAVHIEDKPRFAWRGLMLDVSRHWMPVETVKRNLDAMAAVKLNVFHWHLSDDQGFRIENKRHPRLQELGSDGNFYTQNQIRDVVAYAADRDIRVIPEIDMPGHMTAWFVGYPELASAPGPYSIERKWGVFAPALDPTRPEAYTFLEDVIGEMAALFPDRYFHIGGDELDDAQWKASPSIQAFERRHGMKTSAELQAWFNARIQAILKKHGKTLVGWDEILSPELSSDAVIQSWRGPDSLAEASRRGYRGILSFGYYLDHMLPAKTYYLNDPPAVLGGEACMWTEYASSESVDSRIWPVMAAVAERFWSPQEVRDVDSMYTRMARMSRELDWLGLKHREDRLERLSGNERSPRLHVLAGVSEATGIEVRRDARHYTSLVPLNRFVDAVPPESENTRALEAMAGRRNVTDLEALRLSFEQWSMKDTGNRFPEELTALSKNLSATGVIGLEALRYLESGKAPPAGWIETQRQALDGFERPTAEVVLAAVRPVRILLEALNQ
jgi:hexosaminidase